MAQQVELVQAHALDADLLIGESLSMRAMKRLIDRVAASDASVIITGPSGSGKELVARTIHNKSSRSKKPYVALNCGAIPTELIESELFGHERGSFTGANAKRIGRFEEAHHGTLFLDEIGDMRFDMQVKLLRVLEDGIVNRVGGGSPIPVDVRVISATHRNLEDAICSGSFREDLYFRLGVVPIAVPALADRVEDIPLLVEHFLKQKNRAKLPVFADSAIHRLMQHNWPGNVRELKNIVERATILFPSERIDAAKVEELFGFAKPAANVVQFPGGSPFTETPADNGCSPETPSQDEEQKPIPVDLKELLETMELEHIQFALDNADGVISEAARLLSLKRTTLIEKMRKYGMDRR